MDEQVTGLLTLVTADRHVAEELAQEALKRACANWPRVRVMDNRRAWLRRVALNLAASRYRRRRTERRANRQHASRRPPAARYAQTHSIADPVLLDLEGRYLRDLNDTLSNELSDASQTAIPATYILDREGRIAAWSIGQTDESALPGAIEHASE